MELYQRVEALGDANHEFLLRYKWEWFCSLNLQLGSDYPMAESKLKDWRMKMGVKNHILIAYMGVYNTIPQPHIHLMALGKRNRFGQTLLDLSPKSWEAAWSDLTKCQAVIQPLYLIYDRDQVASYIANKNLPWNKSELIQPYNKRLLVKSMLN
jgi:hypothetical protein